MDTTERARLIRSGDRRALARAITLVESARPDHRAEALALVDGTFDAFTGMFAGFVPRR